MADRAGGTYTPNRKPRRGRGSGGNTPRGSSRGRGESSPTVSSTTSSPAGSTPSQASPSEEAKPVVTVTVTPGTPTEERSPEKTVSPKMESPQEKAFTSATSIDEPFSTPTSLPMSPEVGESAGKLATKTNPTIGISKLAEDNSSPATGSTGPTDSGNLVPDKPPRKTSQPEKTPKVFEPTKVEEKFTTPRMGGDPPLIVEIETRPDPVVPDSSKGKGQPASPASGPSSRVRKITPAASSISPGGFAYGLGGPVGRPGYGVTTHGDEDDPWSTIPSMARRASIAEITKVAKGFSRRQWICLIVFGLADMLSAMIISLQAPFYPLEAEKKGATATEYGLVFGVYELTVFLASPFYGKYMNRLGPKVVFNLGIVLTSLSCICFGLLDKIDDHTLFITLSFVLRITEAVGAAAFVTSAFTIIAFEFPESVATTFASLETFFGLGLIIGPTFGGAMYQIGGYYLPFLITGVTLLLVAIMSSFVMPKIETISDEAGNYVEGYGIFTILRIPSVFLAGLSIAICASTLAFLSATLEPHLRQFALTPLQTGLMFIINGGIYAVSAPVIGFICDRSHKPAIISVLGAFLIFISFLLIGPAPFIPFQTILWVTGIGLGVHGVGLASTFVAGFISALRDSMEYGLPDNISTYGVVSGLWTSTLSLGAFIGPSIGGILLDQVGFQNATYYPLAAELLLLILLIVFFVVSPKPKSSFQLDTESAPLLRPISPLGDTKDSELPSTSAGYGAITTGESQA